MTHLAEKISDMEAQIMKIIWDKGEPVTYREIRERLNEKTAVGSQSIQTMIKRLVRKKILKQNKQEVYYYTALVSEADYKKSKTVSFVEKVFDGDTKGLLTALVNYHEITAEDLEELRTYWEKGEDTDE